MLEVQNLTAAYRDRVALSDISMTVRDGELVGILGPNGAGKSTLFKGILGLIPLQTGEVLYGGRSLKCQRQSVAYVPQRAAIDWAYPICVEQAVLTGRTVQRGWLRFLKKDDKAAAQAAMERLGVWQWRRRPVGELSGGQQQRVFLARAIAQDAQVFLLDEPLTGVDRDSEVLLWDVVDELRQAGKVLVVSGHEWGRSLDRYDQLVLLNRSLVAMGSPGTVLNPENLERTYGGAAEDRSHCTNDRFYATNPCG
ncbi:MAG: metal ABC transporter ATP-binding protein [Cyanobacteria bacterium P01_D01_bin.73]